MDLKGTHRNLRFSKEAFVDDEEREKDSEKSTNNSEKLKLTWKTLNIFEQHQKHRSALRALKNNRGLFRDGVPFF